MSESTSKQDRIDELKRLLHNGVCEYLSRWSDVCEIQGDCPKIRTRIAVLQGSKKVYMEKL